MHESGIEVSVSEDPDLVGVQGMLAPPDMPVDAGSNQPKDCLFEGMKLVAETGKGPTDQVASMGCSIKWK